MNFSKSRRREKRCNRHSLSEDDSRKEKKKAKSLEEQKQRGSRREEESPVLPKSPCDTLDVASRNNRGRKRERQHRRKQREEVQRRKQRRRNSSDEEPLRRKERRWNSSSDDEPPRRKERHRKPEAEDVRKKNKQQKESSEDVPREKPRWRDNSNKESRGTKPHSRKSTRRQRSRSRNRRRNSRRSLPYRRERDFDRRSNYRQIPGKRYWDAGLSNSRNRRHSGSEESVIGDMFCGGTPRQYGRENRNGRNDRNSRGDGNTNNRNDKNDRNNQASEEHNAVIKPNEKRTVDLLTSKTGGAYTPLAKLKLMQAEIRDKSSEAHQHNAWRALEESIGDYIDQVDETNIRLITRELFKENIIRGRGLLAQTIINAQTKFPTLTSVYAALTAVINSKFPSIGKLVLQRLVNDFKRGYECNSKDLSISSGIFIAHLMNQNVAHENVVLQLLMLLVENPTDNCIEVAIAVLNECGIKLRELSKRGIEDVFAAMRNTLNEQKLSKRVKDMIKVMFQVRTDAFKNYEVPTKLDLVEKNEQVTHLIETKDPIDCQDVLNKFTFDPEFQANEKKYQEYRKKIHRIDSSSSDEEEEDEIDEKDREAKEAVIIDRPKAILEGLRQDIYFAIQSSLNFEGCTPKLMRIVRRQPPGEEFELCETFLDCCMEMQQYQKFYGALATWLCNNNKIYVTQFEEIFKATYAIIDNVSMLKVQYAAKIFAHLLAMDSISWEVLSCTRLTNDISSSRKFFLQYLFEELGYIVGLDSVNAKVKDTTLREAFAGLLPRDNLRDTRYAINFFAAFGFDDLTDDLRELLNTDPVPVPPPIAVEAESSSESSSDLSCSGSESSSKSSGL